MALETRILVLATQSAANDAQLVINANLGIGVQANSTTISYAYPRPFPGDTQGRWYLPFPGDDALLSGIPAESYWVSPGIEPVAATAPLASTISAPLTLRDKFTEAEIEAITCAATKEMVLSGYTSAKLQMLMDTLDAASTFGLDTVRVQQGMLYLVGGGFVTPARANTILAPVGVLPQANWK